MNSFNAQTTEYLKGTLNQLNAPSQLIQDDSGVTTSSSIANLETTFSTISTDKIITAK